jgi:hypothetical protein
LKAHLSLPSYVVLLFFSLVQISTDYQEDVFRMTQLEPMQASHHTFSELEISLRCHLFVSTGRSTGLKVKRCDLAGWWLPCVLAKGLPNKKQGLSIISLILCQSMIFCGNSEPASPVDIMVSEIHLKEYSRKYLVWILNRITAVFSW